VQRLAADVGGVLTCEEHVAWCNLRTHTSVSTRVPGLASTHQPQRVEQDTGAQRVAAHLGGLARATHLGARREALRGVLCRGAVRKQPTAAHTPSALNDRMMSGVQMGPGAMALTWMPLLTSWLDSERVNAICVCECHVWRSRGENIETEAGGSAGLSTPSSAHRQAPPPHPTHTHTDHTCAPLVEV
jgi:hypothetical protein